MLRCGLLFFSSSEEQAWFKLSLTLVGTTTEILPLLLVFVPTTDVIVFLFFLDG
ncbi:uncharacterized protein DS421_15g507280 [Arachis hypogaea]|nr:uncharacterized protein DS421_15g507280 [Arachis hypogaea]